MGNLQQLLPDCLLKRRTGRLQRNGKGSALAREVLESVFGSAKGSDAVLAVSPHSVAFHAQKLSFQCAPICEFKQDQSIVIGYCIHRPDGRCKTIQV